MEIQKFWNKGMPRSIDGVMELRNDISDLGNWFKDKFGSKEKPNMIDLYKVSKSHK